MANRPAFQINWNEPPGQINTRCAECGGDGVVIVERAYMSGDDVGTVRVPAQCKACRGVGKLAGLHPPS